MEAPEKKAAPSMTVITMKHTGSHDDIGKVYHELHRWASTNNVRIAGKGFTEFLTPPHEFNPALAEFEVCLPVDGDIHEPNAVTVKEIPACEVASVTIQGPYSDMPARYTEMLAWLDSQGWEICGNPREVYIKRPAADGSGDPDKFITEIQFPIKD